MAARLDAMSVDNLGAFNTYRDESDESEFDVKQSSRDEMNALLGASYEKRGVDDGDKDSDNVTDELRKHRSSLMANAAEQ